MVAYDNAIATDLYSASRIRDALDALEQEWFAA